jgi:hypothetical protein
MPADAVMSAALPPVDRGHRRKAALKAAMGARALTAVPEGQLFVAISLTFHCAKFNAFGRSVPQPRNGRPPSVLGSRPWGILGGLRL